MQTLLFIHLLCVSLWVGGQLFLLAVVMPAARKLPAEQRTDTIRAVARQYGVVSVPVLLLIVLTGGAMAGRLHLSMSDNTAFEYKMICVAIAIGFTVLHIVAGRKHNLRLSRIATAVTGIASIAAVWFAVHI